MEQRPPRVGDLVDDYCPRERRLTNHTIVAIVGEEIRQTRCSTCDADHPYKDGRAPRPRKRAQETLPAAPVLSARVEEPSPALQAAAPMAARADVSAEVAEPAPVEQMAPREDLWPAHRTLIRATLPRSDNDPPTPRPIPEFTMHQRNVRGHQQFRQQGQNWQERGNGQGSGSGNGNGPAHGHNPGGGGGRPSRHRRHRGGGRPR